MEKTSGMEFSFRCRTAPVLAAISRFRGASGVDECHMLVRPVEYDDIANQLRWIEAACREALGSIGLDAGSAVFRRFFCSDLHNQAAALRAYPLSNPCDCSLRSGYGPCAVSWAGQAPAPPAKVAMWAYHISDPRSELAKTKTGPHLTLQRGGLAHHWTTGITSTGRTCHEQSRAIFDRYEALLREREMSTAGNLMRTWLFVRNIDADYQDLVSARREFFAERGLTPETNFVASSGIGGGSADPATAVSMDAYAIWGLHRRQVSFLAAPDHLSPTHLYGVTFERGTSIAYRDRKHIIISGTASIDSQGQIVHPGDVSRQLDRTLENVEALLRQAGAALADVALLIVYVRDPSDRDRVQRQMQARVVQAPFEVVLASVCRPGWLVEVEGIAVVPALNPEMPLF
jgi:enamine deaminase RidA (YjgF/YER057c/UK114 family)